MSNRNRIDKQLKRKRIEKGVACIVAGIAVIAILVVGIKLASKDTAAKNGEPTSIACFGDSITQQGSYTKALSDLGWEVANLGESGTGYVYEFNGRKILDEINDTVVMQDNIFVLGGTNDWGEQIPLGEKTDKTGETFYGALYECFDAITEKYPDKGIYVSTILQRDYEPVEGANLQPGGIIDNGNGDSVADFNEAIIYRANQFGITVLDGFHCGIMDSNLDVYTKDGLHLNEAGGIAYGMFVSTMILQQ